ncbi:hypothetical protein QQF64_020007 [Cirrhinus molitorella]|uniref:Uncharacterized protein n=1 Tax=Cirrhinus molitorella TaxID=172907 RepID=A0ABR3LJH1_9TELE
MIVNPHPNIVAGFAALFASYYNFNLVYQEEASSTLEFVQRQPQQRLEAKKVGKPLRRETTLSALMCVLFSEN